ncbi:hypothetical protein [Streptomyces sp. SID4985]|uniref:hypothetical protein n=1 Tax=unclassified Streptomyces TaxID=2593676 RepID=UPI00136BAC3C|nr:hypothetical protein [Streptomyces sp. SID4985]MYQ44895.1 hypothetical protein [Streptomyces sp. SID4985]
MFSTTVSYRALPVLLPALLAGVLLTGCSAGHDTASASPSPSPTSARTQPISSTPEVRDALAVLRATYNDGCTTPDNCEYFLTRVHDNLEELAASMKADPQGKSHFAAPLAWTDTLRGTLGKDTSFPNLEKHQKLLLDTRDKINAWMRSHPEDYR